MRSAATFSFYDLTDAQDTNPDWRIYVVTATLFKNASLAEEDGVAAREYVRALWEIVPGERFPSVGRLISTVLTNNPEEHFTHEASGASAHFRYRMTTDEVLLLDFRFPAHLGIGIREIVSPDGSTQESDDIRVLEEPFSFPLIDVREVDSRFRFTGRTFAHSSGDGFVGITSHFANFGLTLDSRDYRHPERHAVILG